MLAINFLKEQSISIILNFLSNKVYSAKPHIFTNTNKLLWIESVLCQKDNEMGFFPGVLEEVNICYIFIINKYINCMVW